MARLDAFFKLMFDSGASDLHITSGQPPILRVHGDLERAVELPGVRGVDRILHAGLLGEELLHLRGRHVLAEPHGQLFEARQQLAGW